MQPKGMRRMRRFLGVLLASLFIGGQALGAGTTPSMSLTQLLEDAQACGPAFRDLARVQQRQGLAEQREQSSRLPASRVSFGVRLNPSATMGGVTTVDWQLTDDISVDINLPLGTPMGSGTMGAARSSLAVNWSKAIWPVSGADLRTQLDALDQHIGQLDYKDQEFTAWSDVISAFYTLRSAHDRLHIAQRSQVLAQGRADHALARYEQGLIGLRDLQTEQSSLHQVIASVQRALFDVQQAWERLTTLVGTAECGADLASGAELVDDVDWDAAIQAVADLLDLPVAPGEIATLGTEPPTDAWEEYLLARSVTYQRAVRGVLSAELALAHAESSLRPSVTAGATVSTDLKELDPAWSVGVNVVWDLAPNLHIDVRGAGLDVEDAFDRLAQARRATLDAVRTAWRTLTDAAGSLARAKDALTEALRTQELVERRIEAGLSPAIEAEEAQLEVDRRSSEVRDAEAQLNLAWLTFAHRFGVDVVGL